MSTALGFLVMISTMVVVHEFGHFLFAKIFKVRADVFSVGFGPQIFSRQLGETEFRLAAIPMGGYVKLFGSEPDAELTEEEKPRSLQHQVAWKRFLIFFGGPLFNFLLSIFIFMVVLVIGEPKVSNLLGRVAPGSYAEIVGFMDRDRVLSVGGVETKQFFDVIREIEKFPSKKVSVELERDGQKETLELIPESEPGLSEYGEAQPVGVVGGLLPYPASTKIGISDSNSFVAKKGLKTGEYIKSLNGRILKSWPELEGLYLSIANGREINFVVGESAEGKSTDDRTLTWKKPISSRGSLATDFGLHSAELFVQQVVDDHPAKDAGIEAGDRLLSVGQINLRSFYELRTTIQKQSENDGELTIGWERNGKTMSATFIPKASIERNRTLEGMKIYTIGVLPMLERVELEVITERYFNPAVLLYKATGRMFDLTGKNLVSIGKMVIGDVSVKALGGPILIGKIAGETWDRGVVPFLTMMAVLSVGLGILNLMPIPVLDGGHLFLLGIEVVRGKPLSVRHMELVQQVGLTLIIILMVVVMRNDIMRLF